MKNFLDYKDLNIKERMEKFIPSPHFELSTVLAYERAKISNNVEGIEYTGLINTAKQKIEPFIRGGLNPDRETLEFLNLSGKGFYDNATIGDFKTYESLLEFKNIEDKEELNQVETGDLIHFFVKNFGFDFTEQVFESKIDSYPKRVEDKSLNYGHLVNHISGIKSVYKKPYIHSKSLRIEIFPNEGINEKTDLSLSDMIGWTVGFLGLTPYYIERSKIWDSSAIIYCELSKYMNDKKKKLLEDFFISEYKIQIHLQKSDEYCLLPYSADYALHGSYNIKNRFRVDQKSFFEIANSFLDKKINSVVKMEKMIGTLDLGIVVAKRSKTDDELIQTYIKRSKESRALEKFQYGNRSRFHTWPKLSMWCARQSYSLATFIDLAYLCNTGGSKDMKKWNSSKIRRELNKCFQDSLSKVVITTRNDESNEDENNRTKSKSYNIKDNDNYTWLDEKESERELRNYLNIRFNKVLKSKRQKGAWLDYKINDCVNLCKFILRKKAYDDDSDLVYEKEFEILNTGTLISNGMFKDLAAHLGFKSNIKEIFNYLIEFGLISKVYIGKYYYSFKDKVYATHYVVKNCLISLLKLVKLNTIKYNKNINNKYNKYNKNIIKNNLFSSVNYVVNVHFSRLSRFCKTEKIPLFIKV